MSKSDPKMNEAVGPFQILAAVAGHLATLREHVERMAKPTFDPEEEKAWGEITEYLDRLRIKRIRPAGKRPRPKGNTKLTIDDLRPERAANSKIRHWHEHAHCEDERRRPHGLP